MMVQLPKSSGRFDTPLGPAYYNESIATVYTMANGKLASHPALVSGQFDTDECGECCRTGSFTQAEIDDLTTTITVNVGDSVSVTEDFARLGCGTVLAWENREDGQVYFTIKPAGDQWDDFGEPQGDGTWVFPANQVSK